MQIQIFSKALNLIQMDEFNSHSTCMCADNARGKCGNHCLF